MLVRDLGTLLTAKGGTQGLQELDVLGVCAEQAHGS
jgi:hypothetical protein